MPARTQGSAMSPVTTTLDLPNGETIHSPVRTLPAGSRNLIRIAVSHYRIDRTQSRDRTGKQLQQSV